MPAEWLAAVPRAVGGGGGAGGAAEEVCVPAGAAERGAGRGGAGGRAWRERGSERGRGWDHFWEGLRGDLPLARVLPGARREIFPGECTLTARVVRRRVLAAVEGSIPPAPVRPPPPAPY